jgi:hypothetical protein
MRKLLKKNNGQVIVISIAALLVIFILVIVVVETGNLVYNKVHMQNIADSGAVEAGLWYARSLNVIALTNKALGVLGFAGILTAVVDDGATLKAAQELQKVQDSIIAGMPIITAGAVVRNGGGNGVISIPLFNTANFQSSHCMPSFNLERRYLIGGLTQKKRTYTVTKDGKKIELTEAQARRLVYDEKIRNRNEAWKSYKFDHDPEFGDRYVGSKEKDVKADLPLDIIETDKEHTVLVLSFKKDVPQILNNGFLKDNERSPIKPAFLLSTAMVRVSGGSMNVFDPSAANYSPKIEQVQLPQVGDPQALAQTLDKAGDILKSTGLDSSGNSAELFGKINSGIQLINDDILLH